MIHPWQQIYYKKCKLNVRLINHASCLDPKQRRISRQCNAAERLPRRGPSPSLSSYFAQSDDRVLIRKHWLLNPLFSSAVLVGCVNQGLSETSGISGISIRTGQLFLCGYTTAGSLLIAPDTQPNISRYRPPVKGSVVSVGLCSSAPTHLQTSYLFCSVGKTNQC